MHTDRMLHTCIAFYKKPLLPLLMLVLSNSLCAQESNPRERTYALRTLSGYYLTAENGGGASVNTDRKELGPWETFVMVPAGPGLFSFRTENGHYVGDLNGDRRTRQGRGGLGATKQAVDSSTQFKLILINPEIPVVVLMTSDGKYVTAENGGGVKARAARAVATDRTEIGEWEQFVLVDLQKPRRR